MDLTKEQERIIKENGDLVVIAGPGTGKTFTLLNKISYLIEKGENPEKIFLLTYNLKIAKELKRKLEEKNLFHIKVDTFHGLAYDLWKIAYQKEPPLINEIQKKEILKKLFGKAKNPLKYKENLKIYYEFLEKNNLLDFDLLLIKAKTLLNYVVPKYIIIDEFQDLSQEIWEFLICFKQNSSFEKPNFIFFGDPNQCVYGFKGVNLDLTKEFINSLCPDHRTFYLSLSFRCPQEILNIAEKFKCSPWHVPYLKSTKKGGRVQGFIFPSLFQEKKEVCKIIKELLGGLSLETQKHDSAAPGEIFILSRLKVVYSHIKETIQEEGIPVYLPEEDAEVKYHLCLKTVEAIETSITPDIEKILENSEIEIRPFLKTLWELSLRDKNKFLLYLKNIDSSDFLIPKVEGINFLSIHSSKGLEARYVFLIGAEEGLIPLTLFKDTSYEEEKRLLYVALTRTKESFFFTSVKKRKIFNFTLEKGLSSFLKNKDIPTKTFSPTPKIPKQKTLF